MSVREWGYSDEAFLQDLHLLKNHQGGVWLKEVFSIVICEADSLDASLSYHPITKITFSRVIDHDQAVPPIE